MAITHSTAIRNGIADYVVDAIDAGGAGSLEFLTSGDVVVATITFQATAFDAAGAAGGNADGVATMNTPTTDETSAPGGVVSKFTVKSGAGSTIFSGSSVLTSGGDINLTNLTIGVGDTVSLTSLTYTAPL